MPELRSILQGIGEAAYYSKRQNEKIFVVDYIIKKKKREKEQIWGSILEQMASVGKQMKN